MIDVKPTALEGIGDSRFQRAEALTFLLNFFDELRRKGPAGK